jgi:hypothetical protein
MEGKISGQMSVPTNTTNQDVVSDFGVDLSLRKARNKTPKTIAAPVKYSVILVCPLT